jgi:lysyl-tRNA synthetase class II
VGRHSGRWGNNGGKMMGIDRLMMVNTKSSQIVYG